MSDKVIRRRVTSLTEVKAILTVPEMTKSRCAPINAASQRNNSANICKTLTLKLKFLRSRLEKLRIKKKSVSSRTRYPPTRTD